MESLTMFGITRVIWHNLPERSPLLAFSCHLAEAVSYVNIFPEALLMGPALGVVIGQGLPSTFKAFLSIM